MKIKLFSITVLVVTITTIGCNKITNTDQMTEAKPMDKTTQKIVNFGKSIKAVRMGEKSGDEKMSLEDAKWNIEAALNYYNHSTVNNDDIEFITEELNINITPINGELAITEISNLAIAMNSDINSDPTKKLVSAEIKVVDKEDGTKVMKLITTKSIGSPIGFGIEDYWNFWSGGGYCGGPNEGQDTDYGAPEALSRQINSWGIGGLGSFSQRFSGFYYTNVTSYDYLSAPHSYYDSFGNQYSFLNPNDDIPNDGYLDYMIFHHGEYNGDDCLSPDEMNYYALIGMPYVIQEMIYDGNSFMRVSTESTSTGCIDCENEYFHFMTIQQGIKHEIETTPVDNPFM